ncbi:MAG TPA: hypothetical protein VNR37_03635 [Microbacteriaceae bacterium]|nr:hypothetical protein [Microbacteriaceae bacterium]
MRKKNVLLAGAAIGLVAALGVAIPASALTVSGYKNCPGGASAVSLETTTSHPQVTHFIASQKWDWEYGYYHYSVSNSTAASWKAETYGTFTAGPTPYCT